MSTLFPRTLRRLLLPALILLAAASAAPAQTIITTAPYVITQAGSYRVGANLAVSNSSQPIIKINAPNVELDLGGYTLSAPAASDGSVALYVLSSSNVTIRNGTVSGSGYGIAFSGGATSSNHLVENVRVVGSRSAGIEFFDPSPGSVVRNNIIVNVGNSTNAAFGIDVHGGVFVADNAISKVTSSSGGSYGIFASNGDCIVGNTINDCGYGISGGKRLNNLTNGCTTPFAGGIDATGNN